METEFWLDKWDAPKRGWSQQQVNSRLIKHWPSLGFAAGDPVLIPLCGDSVDIDWLVASGFSVIGSELSEKGLTSWFDRHALEWTAENAEVSDADSISGSALGSTPGSKLRIFKPEVTSLKNYVNPAASERGMAAIDANTQQQLPMFYCGDFFSLSEELLPAAPIAVYDRAALIALPPPMRARYAEKLGELLPTGSKILLITLIYDPAQMNGPPFSVTNPEVESLYSKLFDIEKIADSHGPDIVGNLADRGLQDAAESVFVLTRNSVAG